MTKLFLGIKGHVVCLDKNTGEEIWRLKLRVDWGKPTIVIFSDDLYVYLSGKFLCLCPESGSVKWVNNLKGLGSGSCIIAVESNSAGGSSNLGTQSAIGEVADVALDLVL